MAAQFDTQRVAYQPQGGAEIIDLTGPFQRQAQMLSQSASQSFATANAAFDQALASYNKMAVENAEADAPALIKRDGNGQLIAPTSFYPPGLHSAAYAEAFKRSGQALYRESATAEYQDYIGQQKALFPADPVSFKTALEQKRQLMLAGLAEDQKAFLDVRFQQLGAQAESQISVNVTAAQNKATLESADRQHAAIVDDALRYTADHSKIAALSGEAKLQAIGDSVVNDAALGERWKDLVATWKRAGVADPQIQRYRDELGYQIFLKQNVEVFKSMVTNGQIGFDATTGQVDQSQYAAMRDKIRELAKTYPGRSEQIESTLMRAFDYSIGQNQAMAQGAQLRAQNKADALSADFYRRGLAAQLAPDEESRRAATQSLQQDALRIMNDPGLGDAAKMRVAGAAWQAGGLAKTALQESYSNSLQGLSAIVNDHTSSPAAKERAYSEVLTMNSDPNVTRYMSTGQRAYAQGIVDTVMRNKIAGDHAGLVIEANEGRTTPEAYQAMLEKGVTSGMYGDHPGSFANMAQVRQMAVTQKNAWAARTAEMKAAEDGFAAVAAGAPTTETQRAAMKAKMGFSLGGEPVAPDGTNPGAPQPQLTAQTYNPADLGHRQRALDYLRKTGELPDVVKSGFTDMPKSADPAVMKPWMEAYGEFYAAIANKQQRFTGKPADSREVQSELANKMGESAALYLAAAQMWGPEAANKMAQAKASPSVTGQLGQPTAEAGKTMDASADSFLTNMVQKGEQSTWYGKLTAGRIPFTDAWKNTQAERTAQSLVGISSDVRPGLIDTARGVFPTFPGGLTFSAEARSFLTGAGTAYLATDGKLISDVVKDEPASDYAFRTMLEKHKDKFELTLSADGRTGTIGFKSWDKAMAEKIGRDKLSESQGQAVAIALVEGERRAHNMVGATYDPKSVSVVPHMTSTGQMDWAITGRDPTSGNPVLLMNISQDDPYMRALRNAMQHAARETMKLNLPGGANDTMGSLLQAPLEGWMRQNYATGRTDQKVFTDELTRQLQAMGRRE